MQYHYFIALVKQHFMLSSRFSIFVQNALIFVFFRVRVWVFLFFCCPSRPSYFQLPILFYKPQGFGQCFLSSARRLLPVYLLPISAVLSAGVSRSTSLSPLPYSAFLSAPYCISSSQFFVVLSSNQSSISLCGEVALIRVGSTYLVSVGFRRIL